MSSSNSSYCNYAAFKPLEQQKKSRFIAGLLLAVVVVLHSALAWYLLSTPKTEIKKPLLVMEVAMLTKPEPVLKAAAKEPPPALPPVKKEPIKPKAVVKPPPLKKPVVVNKPAPSLDIKEMVPVPKFEPVPMVNTAPAAVSPAPSASSSSQATAKTTTTGQGRDESKAVVSGVVPLLRVPPKYPVRAASRHIEGWVTVEFTIQTDGTVGDAVVVSAEPEGIFDEAALTAIGKWEFKEKMVNGVAVTQRAVQRLQFKLEH
ncbi:MAG: energy transducer TonB [Methylococcaceae bacterium]